jgi:hypothetical protein
MNRDAIKRDSEPDLENAPDAWAAFERAVDVVVKAPPQHRPKAKEEKAPPKEVDGDVGTRKKPD